MTTGTKSANHTSLPYFKYEAVPVPIWQRFIKRVDLASNMHTVWSMLSARECRSNSKECERLAREALSPPIRTAWANMARTWRSLANQTDHIENLLRERRTHMP
jgi:hypothetical protein